jgi:hypothetical protein
MLAAPACYARAVRQALRAIVYSPGIGDVELGDQGRDRVKQRSPLIAGLAGAALALAMSATAFGYARQVVAVLTITGPSGPVPCGTPVTLQATALDVTGAPIQGQPVHWGFSSTPSHRDTIKPRSALTNANGVATTTITLACVAGPRTVTAAADKARASAVLNIATGGVLGLTSAGLPNTSTALVGEATDDPPAALLLALLAMLAGGGIMLRRLALGPR